MLKPTFLAHAFPLERNKETSSELKLDMERDLIRWGGLMPRLKQSES